MDRLVDVALVGTARGANPPSLTGSPTDRLVAQLTALDPARQILLAAGTQALFVQAGREPGPGIAQAETAPPDLHPACSVAAARLLESLFADARGGLLPEALERLQRANLRLPNRLLVTALDAGQSDGNLRTILSPVLGTRGVWLAAHNPAWSWARGVTLEKDGRLPADAETIWQEGMPAARLALLRAQRGIDAAAGRAWLAEIWKSEKAEFRAQAVATLSVGLSPGDEPFLEAALDDRSKGVRDEAVRLLTRLPNSALTQRMRERADRLLDYTPHQRSVFRSITQAFSGDAVRGDLTVNFPADIDHTWQRDGIMPQAQADFGVRASWLQIVLSTLHPAHWSQRFAASPTELVAAANAHKWGQVVISGWTRAAQTASDSEWAPALWSYWATIRERHLGAQNARVALLRAMPPATAFALVEPFLAEARNHKQPLWPEFASGLPTPWSVPLARRYLAVTREYLGRAREQRYDPWLNTLPIAARVLPPDLFGEALAEWHLPASSEWWAAQRQRQVDEFTAALRLRQQLIKEIPV